MLIILYFLQLCLPQLDCVCSSALFVTNLPIFHYLDWLEEQITSKNSANRHLAHKFLRQVFEIISFLFYFGLQRLDGFQGL